VSEEWDIPIPVVEIADKLEHVIGLAGPSELLVPAVAVVLGRYVAYEAGRPDRIAIGLDIVWRMARAGAIVEAARLYGDDHAG
jgi:hypothetical protein